MKTLKRLFLALLILGFLSFLGGAALLYSIYNEVAEEAKEKIQRGSVDPVVDLIRKHVCSVIAISPRKESLEDVVVRQARAGDAAAQASEPEGGTNQRSSAGGASDG